jgi:peptide/nickel transport system substrate-binding protein
MPRLVRLAIVAALLLTACAPTPPTAPAAKSEAPAAKPTDAKPTEAAAKPTAAPAPTTAAATQPTAAPAPTAAAAAPAPSAAKKDPVTFTFAHPGPVASMDAPVTWFGATHWLTNLLYDCLIWRKAEGGGYVGQAAEKWERVNDTTWRFTLRPNLKFQNGEALDANAVKWNIDRVRSRKEFMVHPQWQFIADVKAVDPRTVEVLTTKPHAYLEFDISYNGCELLPPGYLQQVGEEEFAKKPIGSGPYKLSELIANQKYTFEAWDGYWGGKPEVDRVVYQVIPEAASQLAALLAGQVDLVANVPIPDRERVSKSSGLTTMRAPAGRVLNLYLRTETDSGAVAQTYPGYKPATLDKKIRYAIDHAIDRVTLAEIQGSAVPTLVRTGRTEPESFASKYFGPENAAKRFDAARAKALIAEAGYAPDQGKRPKVYLDSPTFQFGQEKEVAEAISVMLQDVGFDVQLTVLDNNAFQQQINQAGNNRDIMLSTLGTLPSLVPNFYSCEWKQANYTLCDQEWTALNRQIQATGDPTARLALWEKFWEFYFDWSQTISLYEIDNVMAMNSKFKWTPRADGWMTFRDLTVAR